jgi:hypothetical protein
MCNLYSITKGQAAIIEFTRAMRDTTGNLPPLPETARGRERRRRS